MGSNIITPYDQIYICVINPEAEMCGKTILGVVVCVASYYNFPSVYVIPVILNCKRYHTARIICIRIYIHSLQENLGAS